MNNKRTFHTIPIKFFSSFQRSKILKQIKSSFRWNNWLGWKQWLVLFGLGATIILVEIRNHKLMWIEHKSGQTILTDHMLVGEIFVFGLVLPLVAGLVLSYTGRTAIERDEIARGLALHRELVAQIHAARDWRELSDLIVSTPGNIIAADRTWLLAQRPAEETFTQIASWERPISDDSPFYHPVNPAQCARCTITETLPKTRIHSCNCPEAKSRDFRCNRYCLWLSTEEQGRAVLLIDVVKDRPLRTGQIKVLNDLGDEMSLAIDNANLYYVNQRQKDLAKSERQRIARDLHDTLGQNISFLRLKLEQFSNDWPDPKDAHFQDELANMLHVADEAYEQVRNTLEELRTTEQKDFTEMVRLYSTQLGERAGFVVYIHTSGQSGTLSARRTRQIMYILREALNNVEKHAAASQVDLYLMWGNDEFVLTIRDDGVGFQPEDVDKTKRYGIAIMTERAREINASLFIRSKPGAGSELTLSLPLSSSLVNGSGA